MEILADPVMLGVLKIVAWSIAVIAGIPFIIGIVIGYIVGHR